MSKNAKFLACVDTMRMNKNQRDFYFLPDTIELFEKEIVPNQLAVQPAYFFAGWLLPRCAHIAATSTKPAKYKFQQMTLSVSALK